MRTKRRRQRNTWFPVLGTRFEDTEEDVGFVRISAAAASVTTTVQIVALVPDFINEDSSNADSLSELIGNEYIIERIVGKAHFAYEQLAADVPRSVVLAAGFFIARADDGGTNPIGIAAEINEDYGPLHPNTARQPWMWRRTWAMSNLQANGDDPQSTYPQSTSQGSVLDGPHIDCKSKRRVRQDERLFFAIQAAPLDVTDAGVTAQVNGIIDIRLLGRLVKAKNSSTF